MALSKLTADSFDLTDNYAFTGTVSGVGSTQKLFLIKNIDSSGSTITSSFVDGSNSVDLDNTYKTYLFRFINMHPVDDQVKFEFQGSIDGGSNYNVAITSTFLHAYHTEDGSSAALGYETAGDQAQGTGFQSLGQQVGNGAAGNAVSVNSYIGGYFNTTSAINAIRFRFSGGNIGSGRIALYGIK